MDRAYRVTLVPVVVLFAWAARAVPPTVYQEYPDAKVRINYDAARIPGYVLEDPLVSVGGAAVKTAGDWAVRRREILEIFSREMYGRRPPEPEALVTELVDERITEGGTVLRRQHEMSFRSDRTGPKIRWITFLPRQTAERVPVILFLNFHGNQSLVGDPDIPLMTAWHRNGRWARDNRVIPESRGMMQRPSDSDTAFPLAEFVRRGYAVMSACYCEVSPDPNIEGTEDPKARQDELAYTGVFDLWPRRDPNGLSETTSLGAWSWALSRGLDLAERQPEIDAKRSVVTGCSRLAKAALLAAAYDERFAVCVPVQTGGGGAPLSKRDFGENPATETRQFTHWFCKAYAKYAREPWKTLTFDQHLLLSAVAPRALLVLGFDKPWFDTKGEYLACRAASRVWRTLCGEGLPDVDFPADFDVSAVGRRLGYVRRAGPHAISLQDWAWLLDFADVQFGRRSEFPKPAVGREDFQSQIDAAAAKGGGRVTVPAGRHVTRGLLLKSNVELHLEAGAILEGSPRTNDYPVVELPCSEGRWMAVVMAVGQTNVSVTGRGEVYGNGSVFPRASGKLQEGTRPRGLFFGNCRTVTLRDFTLRDAGCWGCAVQCCDGVDIRRLKIDSHANFNNDGIDLEARNAVIADCDIDAGDDGICLKSNNPDFSVENVLVTNCVVRSFCTPLKLGTASHGIVRNVLMADCRVEAPRRDHSPTRDPLRFEPAYWRSWRVTDVPGSVAGEPAGFSAIAIECVDGGLVDGFAFRNIRIEGGCLLPVFIRADRRMKRATGARRGQHDVLRNVLFENVTGYALSAVPSIVSGLPDFPVQNVTFRNVHLVSRGLGNHEAMRETPPLELSDRTPNAGMFRQAMPAHGLWARHADTLRLENTTFDLDTRPPVVFEDVR